MIETITPITVRVYGFRVFNMNTVLVYGCTVVLVLNS